MRAIKIILIAAIIAAAVGGAYLLMSESARAPKAQITQATETEPEDGGLVNEPDV